MYKAQRGLSALHISPELLRFHLDGGRHCSFISFTICCPLPAITAPAGHSYQAPSGRGYAMDRQYVLFSGRQDGTPLATLLILSVNVKLIWILLTHLPYITSGKRVFDL